MLDPRQLTSLQGFAGRTLDLTAKIERNTGNGTDGMGHPTETWTTLASAAPCGLSEPSAGKLQQYAALIGSAQAWQVSFLYTTDVARNDRLTIGGQIMRVQVNMTLGSYSTLTQVLATAINELVR